MKPFDDFTPQQLAEFWCIMNRGGWPRALGPSEDATCLKRLQWDIVRKIGFKACMRAWSGLDEAEFEREWAKDAR